MIERIAIVMLGLAIAAGAGVIIWAVRRSNAKRARLAAVYDERGEDTEPVQLAQLEVRVRSVTIPPAPLPRPPSPAARRTVVPATRTREPIRSVYTPPSMPAEPGPVLFGDPVSLSSPSFEAPAAPGDDGFKGGGGTFGGAGASGGWDAPADNGGGYSGDSGGSSDGGSSGGNEAA